MLLREPTLALAGVVIPKQRCRAHVPARAESFTQLHAHARICRDIANVTGFRTMLGDNPELLANASVPHGCAARLSGLAANGFQERVPWREDPQDKQQLDGRIQDIFLEEMDDAAFHSSDSRKRPAFFSRTIGIAKSKNGVG